MPPARWGPSLQTAAGGRGARPGPLCRPRLHGHSESRMPASPQRLGRPAALCLPPGRCGSSPGLRRRPGSQPTPMTRTSAPSPRGLPPAPPAPLAPSCQAGTRPSHPVGDSRAGRGRQGRHGGKSLPGFAATAARPSKVSISCASASRAGQPVACGAFARLRGPAKHSSGDCPHLAPQNSELPERKDSPELGTRPGPPPAETDAPRRSRV